MISDEQYKALMETGARMNCIQKAIDTVCQKYGRNADLTFLALWGLNYEDKGTIWRSIGIDFLIPPQDFLKKFLGLEHERYEVTEENAGMALEKGKKFLDGGFPVVLYMDSYFCPWNSAFQKAHITHYVNVLDFDITNGKIICKDDYVEKDKEFILPIEYFISGCVELIPFTNLNVDLEYNYLDIYRALTAHYSENDTCINKVFSDLAERILRTEAPEQIFNSPEPQACKLIVLINQISDVRIGIAGLLCKLDSELEGSRIEGLWERFYQMGMGWKKINSNLLKMLITHTTSEKKLNTVAEIIIETGKLENDTYNALCEFIKI